MCRGLTRTHFAEGQILLREGDRADGVFRLLSGTVDVLRELDGDLILLGIVGRSADGSPHGPVAHLTNHEAAKKAPAGLRGFANCEIASRYS